MLPVCSGCTYTTIAGRPVAMTLAATVTTLALSTAAETVANSHAVPHWLKGWLQLPAGVIFVAALGCAIGFASLNRTWAVPRIRRSPTIPPPPYPGQAPTPGTAGA